MPLKSRIMSGITKSDYATWKTSTFGRPYDIWHDGLYTEAVTTLTGDERALAVEMLTFGVQQLDEHAATALAAMDETSALPHLRAALPATAGTAKVSVANAISSLSRQEDSSAMAKEMISVLEAPGVHWGVTMKAAIGLREFNDQESEDALLRAVESKDNDYLVKYHACESLLSRWGVESSSISSHRGIFGLIGDAQQGDEILDNAERGMEAARRMKALKK
jgi:HEAT repeat protein